MTNRIDNTKTVEILVTLTSVTQTPSALRDAIGDAITEKLNGKISACHLSMFGYPDLCLGVEEIGERSQAVG